MNRLAHNTREHRIMRLLQNTQASEILYHHRFPTSTENVRNACHPFSTKNFFKKNYVLVHNGIVWNDTALSTRHQDRGIKYVSRQDNNKFNDSEALLWDIALYLEGEQDKLYSKGDIAFIVVENEKGKPSKLHFGRNEGSPLYMDFGRKGMSLASQIDENNEAHLLPSNIMNTFDYDTYKLVSAPLEIPEYWPPQQPYLDNSWEQWEGEGIYLPRLTNTFDSLTIEERYWDNQLQDYVSLSKIEYGSDSYYSMIADKGESLAFELLAETGHVDEAMRLALERADSLNGKLTRINTQSRNYRAGTKKLNKLNKERMSIWVQTEVTEQAILQLQETINDEAGDNLKLTIRNVLADRPEIFNLPGRY